MGIQEQTCSDNSDQHMLLPRDCSFLILKGSLLMSLHVSLLTEGIPITSPRALKISAQGLLNLIPYMSQNSYSFFYSSFHHGLSELKIFSVVKKCPRFWFSMTRRGERAHQITLWGLDQKESLQRGFHPHFHPFYSIQVVSLWESAIHSHGKSATICWLTLEMCSY